MLSSPAPVSRYFLDLAMSRDSTRFPVFPAMAAVLLFAPGVARAVPPLVLAVEVAGESVEVYLRPGDLLLSQNKSETPGLALRPLEGDGPSPLPADLDRWTALPFGDCDGAPSFRWKREDQNMAARVTGEWTAPMVEVLVGGTVVALAPLGRPAHVCGLHVANVDNIPGEEILVLWQTTPQATTSRGLTVMRVPATAN